MKYPRPLCHAVTVSFACLALASCAPSPPTDRSEAPTQSAASLSAEVDGSRPRSLGVRSRVKQTPPGIEAIVVPMTVTEKAAEYRFPRRDVSAYTMLERPTPAHPNPPPGRGMRVSPADVERAAFQPPAYPQPLAAASRAFESSVFDDSIAETGSIYIPPDPHVAAGPDHIVDVTNVIVSFYQKNGTLDLRDSLGDFFADLSPLTETFDPKVLYDQFEDRWVMLTLERTDAESVPPDPADTSRILLAVSDDSDPNGTWYFSYIDALLNVDYTPTGVIGEDTWADYPGFAVDEEAVYITVNLFCFADVAAPITCNGLFAGTRLYAIDKGVVGGWYAGQQASGFILNPFPPGPYDDYAGNSQPAHIFGTPPAGAVGTYLTSYNALTDGTNEAVLVVTLNNPLGASSFSYEFVILGDVESSFPFPLPDAPQSGSADLIEVNDRRTLDAVWRNDVLYVTTTLLPDSLGGADADDTTAMLLEIDTSATPSIIDTTPIGGEDIGAGTFTFFPSVAVNDDGEVGVGFSASGPSIFAGAYYATREGGSAFGASGTVHVGKASYYRTLGGARNRWGDYTGAALDPATGCIWFYNQYAETQGTMDSYGDVGRWGTANQEVCFAYVFADGFENGDTSAWSASRP